MKKNAPSKVKNEKKYLIENLSNENRQKIKGNDGSVDLEPSNTSKPI
jgi:hypothetical protein